MGEHLPVDCTLYLVTDSTTAVLGDKDLLDVVSKAVEGGKFEGTSQMQPPDLVIGVTMVQYRDKTSGTADLIRIGSQLLEITKKYNVPLLINDRVDVACALHCAGVHIGQEDMGMSIF